MEAPTSGSGNPSKEMEGRQHIKTMNKTNNEIGKLYSCIETAAANEQPIMISISAGTLKELMDYYAEQRTSSKMAEAERQAKEQNDNISPKEAKEILHISDATLWRYAKDGVLNRKYVGGKVYYSRSEINKFMEG